MNGLTVETRTEPHGTTLLETVIASGLLAMVILATFNTIASSDILDVAAREEQKARAAAITEIDRMRGTNFVALSGRCSLTEPEKKLVDMTELNRTEDQMIEGERGVGVLNIYFLTAPYFNYGQAVEEEVIGIDLDGKDSNGDGIVNNDVLNLSQIKDINDPSRPMFPFSFDSGRGADLFPVVVTVRWISQLGGRRSISMMTLLTDRTGSGG